MMLSVYINFAPVFYCTIYGISFSMMFFVPTIPPLLGVWLLAIDDSVILTQQPHYIVNVCSCCSAECLCYFTTMYLLDVAAVFPGHMSTLCLVCCEKKQCLMSTCLCHNSMLTLAGSWHHSLNNTVCITDQLNSIIT